MATIDDIRIIIGDMAKFDRQTATGDASTRQFIASSLPIIDSSESVTVDGTVKTKPGEYIIDYDLGLVTFVTAPASAAVIAMTFQYAELSDASLTALVALQSNAYAAAAMAARSIAGRYSSMVDKRVGDLAISYSQRAKQWLDIAKKIESMPIPIAAGSGTWLGGMNKSEKDSNRADTSLTDPFFTRDMMKNTTVIP